MDCITETNQWVLKTLKHLQWIKDVIGFLESFDILNFWKIVFMFELHCYSTYSFYSHSTDAFVKSYMFPNMFLKNGSLLCSMLTAVQQCLRHKFKVT